MRTKLFLLGLMMYLFSSATGQTVSLDGEWRYREDPGNVGVDEGWFRPSHDDSKWETATVPGLMPDSYDGVAWYRHTVAVPPALAAQDELLLVFGAVDDLARVWVNGNPVASNSTWNRLFFAHIPKSGPEYPARLDVAVRVEDLGGPGGIWKSVRLQAGTADIADLYRNEYTDRQSMTRLTHIGDNVMYSVFVRNFSPEGTFDALRARLPELKGLGVDILWLLPIHEIGVEKRKGTIGSPYAIKDYYSIHPGLGTEEDFRELVDAVHAEGMKIIIDLVLNHTSPDSVLVEQHPDWFVRDPETGKPRADNPDWWDIVDLDWENPAVWDYCEEFMLYWVREFDIDGYRADVASLMPTPFWERVRAKLDEVKPGIIMLAESDAAELHMASFDLSYNWALYDALVGVLAEGLPLLELKNAIIEARVSAPQDATRINFVENHDKERALNIFKDAERARLAAALCALLPGVPMLYTGTEVGASEVRDIFEKLPTTFETDEHGMRAYWSSLLALRRAHPALQTGSLQFVECRPADGFLAFERTAGANRVLVVANMRASGATVELEHPLTPTDSLYLGPWQWTVFGNGAPVGE